MERLKELKAREEEERRRAKKKKRLHRFISRSILITHCVTFKASYAIPLVVAAVIGLLCLLVPPWRPSRLQP